ncbi:MAG: hypothetical protein K1X71_11970 [Pirellulales bacterium]|nr:hypothetical protein [Pirellulales bacterium]
MKKTARLALAASLCLLVAAPSRAAVVYFNGFETDTAGWTNAIQTPSGTSGIPSAAGNYHAVYGTPSVYTNWGGYNYGAGNAVPTVFQPYVTSIDIYLDLDSGAANNTRFDFSSAINNSGGTHKRDFIFNGGFYNSADVTGPGAGTDRFVISASNNSQPGSAYAKNPAKGPIAISNTGWYKFEHSFYNNAGVLAVDMSIYDSSNSLVNSWTLSDPSDLIGGVGGNRYGWFDYNQFPVLAFDNSQLSIVPEPASVAIWSLLGASALVAHRRSRKKS